MTATPTPEAAAAPTTENSAQAGPDRSAANGPDRSDEGRRLVIASAHGTRGAGEWVADAQSAGATVMRLTDIVETGLADCLNDPEARYEEMDSRARAAVDAGMGVVLDLSFIRDAAIRDGLNPYRADFDWEPYITSLLTRPFPAGGAYGTSEHVVYISLPGEPRVDWGDDPNQRAETAEDLIAFYQRLARAVRRVGVDRPLAAAGFIHHTADGNGTDAGLDITAVYSLVEIDVCTTHAYDQESLDALPMLTRYAHALGKPFILEETGRGADERSDDEHADWLARVRGACAAAGVDGVGVWDADQSRGFDVQPPQYPLTAAAVRRMVDAVIPEGIAVQKDPVTHGEHAATPDEAAEEAGPGEAAPGDAPTAGAEGGDGADGTHGDDGPDGAGVAGIVPGTGTGEPSDALDAPAPGEGVGRDGGAAWSAGAAGLAVAGSGSAGSDPAGGDAVVAGADDAGVVRPAAVDEPDDAEAAVPDTGFEPDGRIGGSAPVVHDEAAVAREPGAPRTDPVIDVEPVPAPDAAVGGDVRSEEEAAIWRSTMRTPGATTDSGGAGRHARADEDDAVSGSMPTEAAAGRTAGAATGTGAAAHVGAGAEAVRDEVGGNAPSRTPTSADDEPDGGDDEDAAAVEAPRRDWSDLPPLS